MTDSKTMCSLCDEPIADGSEYYDIEGVILCNECYDAIDVYEAVDLFSLDASDILDMHTVTKKTKEEGKPAPEPPIPGQLVIKDDGSLQECIAGVNA